MAHYVMSDIHGQLDAYKQMLELIQFSSSDKLFIVGDVIDRGKYGIEILQHIMAQDNMTLIRGNHEQLMLDGLTGIDLDSRMIWTLGVGGLATFDRFDKLSEKEQTEIYQYIDNTPLDLWVDVDGDTYHMVHASVSDDVHKKLWYRMGWLGAHLFDTGDEYVITGHTPTNHYRHDRKRKPDEDPRALRIFFGDGGLIGIDCGCAFEEYPGRLGCLRLEDWAEFYVDIWKTDNTVL